MKLIAVTSPSFFEGEVSFLNRLAANGFDLIHLRKPNATAEESASLLEELDETTRRKTVVHQHFTQAIDYNLHGIHLNRRNSQPLPNYGGSISRSCHSLDEVMEWKLKCDYVFLSPIFDSISKSGYSAAFSPEILAKAASEGIIDDRVYALGGVTPDHFRQLEEWHFGGAAMLGYLQKYVTQS